MYHSEIHDKGKERCKCTFKKIIFCEQGMDDGSETFKPLISQQQSEELRYVQTGLPYIIILNEFIYELLYSLGECMAFEIILPAYFSK